MDVTAQLTRRGQTLARLTCALDSALQLGVQLGALRLLLCQRGSGRQRHLLVRSAAIGDFLVVVPFIVSYLRDHPDVLVDVLVLTRVPGNPAAVLSIADQSQLRLSLAPEDLIAEIRRVRDLATARRYDRVVYLPFNGESAVAKAKKLLLLRGIVGPWVQIDGFARHRSLHSLSCLRLLDEEPVHQAAVSFFLSRTKAPTRDQIARALKVTRDDEQRADVVLEKLEKPSPIALYIGAKLERKKWPADRFAEIARWLLHAGRSIVIIGGADDRDAAAAFLSSLNTAHTVNACGVGGLSTTIAILRRCCAACGTDGSPMQMAALCGLRIVALASNFEPWGLWEPTMAPSSITLRPDDGVAGYGTSVAMHAIQIEQVMAAVNKVENAATGQHEVWLAGCDGKYKIEHLRAGYIADL